MSGQTSYYAGVSAENSVARLYEQHGRRIERHRWRGRSGEVDLIARDGETLVFIEVKKSRDFARAAERVSRRQMQRIYSSASEYIAREPDGQNTSVRFDVALVNSLGEIDVIENAFGL